jgi:anthranilate phosphoribosyltransferase
MEQSTNLVEEAALEMDEMLAGVMPDTWIGHARIAIATKDLTPAERHKVLTVTEKLVTDKGTPADKTAEMVITKI